MELCYFYFNSFALGWKAAYCNSRGEQKFKHICTFSQVGSNIMMIIVIIPCQYHFPCFLTEGLVTFLSASTFPRTEK